MRRWDFFLPVFFCCLPLFAQSTAVPVLHRRDGPGRSGPVQPVNGSAHNQSTLPEDVFGEYEFGRADEVVEIALDDSGLSGYISLLGDKESDKSTPLTFFFDRTFARQRQVGFTTRQVHGVWYAFEGTIARGPGLVRGDEGYYLLEGILTTHDAGLGTQTQRTVRLKSLPGFSAQTH